MTTVFEYRNVNCNIMGSSQIFGKTATFLCRVRFLLCRDIELYQPLETWLKSERKLINPPDITLSSSYNTSLLLFSFFRVEKIGPGAFNDKTVASI